jgi:hypothetical protein
LRLQIACGALALLRGRKISLTLQKFVFTRFSGGGALPCDSMRSEMVNIV